MKDTKGLILRLINDHTGSNYTDELPDDTKLADLGLDSLDVVELEMAYEDETNTRLPDTTVPPITIRDLCDLLN